MGVPKPKWFTTSMSSWGRLGIPCRLRNISIKMFIDLYCIKSVRNYLCMVQPERTWPRTFLLGVEWFLFLLRVDKKRHFYQKNKMRKANNFESAGFGFQIKKIDRGINTWRPRVVSIIYIAFIRLHFTFFSWRLVQGHGQAFFVELK